MAYRILLPLYLAAWMIAHIVDRRDSDGAHWLIFITNWGSVLFLTSSTLAAIVVLIFNSRFYKTKDHNKFSAENGSIRQNINIHWTLKLFWALYITSQTVTVMVCIGYWSTQYKPCNGASRNSTVEGHCNQTVNGENCGADVLSIHVHGVNPVLAVSDIILSLVPFNILHFFYPCAFTAVYVVFSGIYYAAGGRNESGDPYIYSLLNYREDPARSSLAAIFLVLLPGLIYIIPLTVAIIRDRLYQWVSQKCSLPATVKKTENGAQESQQKLNFSNPSAQSTSPSMQ